MDEKKKAPKLRFKGFTDDWKQRCLIEMLAQPITDGPHETPNLVKRGIPFISVEAVMNNRLDFTRKRGFISSEYNDQCNKKYKPQLHDVYLVKSGSTVGKVAIVETNMVFNIWSPLAAMRVNEFNNAYFLYYLLQTDNLQDQIKKKSKGGTQPNLSMRILEKCITNSTNLKEETQIALILNKVDKLLLLQQRKLEQLKLVKKALLQDLFTSKEASILRFKGFSGKWEKHKLGDFGTVAMNKRIFKNQTTETGDIPFYKIGTFGKKANSFISRKLFEQYKKRYPYPQKGDLLISASGSIGRIIEYKGEAAYYQDSNIVWLNHNNKLLNSFLKAYYQIIHWDGIEGSTIKRLYNKNILLTKIYLPTLKEQQEIGVLFKVIDEEIDLQQKRISKLQTIKQFLLQNMFI